MDFTVTVGDQLILWWPNGHGFDVFEVRYPEAMEGPQNQIVYKASFEVTDTGEYKKK